jgi:hypothetical protein
MLAIALGSKMLLYDGISMLFLIKALNGFSTWTASNSSLAEKINNIAP